MKSSYTQIDHTGDAGIDATAESLEELFACCARALFDIIAGAEPFGSDERVPIALDAPDLERLMVRWLRELHYLHEAGRQVFTAFDIGISVGPEGCSVRGEARGETFDPARHSLRTEVKAVTYHQIGVRRGDDGLWRARVVFDL